MMELRDLPYFLAVVEELNVHQAARPVIRLLSLEAASS
jgi:hypothetical protein